MNFSHLLVTGGLVAAGTFPGNFSGSFFGSFHSATCVEWGHTGSPGGEIYDYHDDDGDYGNDDGDGADNDDADADDDDDGNGNDDDGEGDDNGDGNDDDIYLVASSSPFMQRRERLVEFDVSPEQTKQLVTTFCES